MVKSSFVFYGTFLETAEELGKIDKDLAYDYLMATIKYGINGEVVEDVNPIVRAVMPTVYATITAAKERYVKSVENGGKGGRPRTIDHGEVIKLSNQGKSNKEISSILNCSESSVRKILRNESEWNLE